MAWWTHQQTMALLMPLGQLSTLGQLLVVVPLVAGVVSLLVGVVPLVRGSPRPGHEP